MVKPVQFGRATRMSYGKINEVERIPDLLEIQKNSYDWFLREGLIDILRDFSPIRNHAGDFEVSFVETEFDRNAPLLTIEECKERDAHYAGALRVKTRLLDKSSGVVKEQSIYIGDLPIMTDTGSFIINGAERVIISQLVRSPGAYFTIKQDKNGVETYAAQIIPNRGAWLEYESDANGVLWVRLDRNRKFHLSIFLRALGLGSNQEILAALGDERTLVETMTRDGCTNTLTGLQELYKKMRSGEIFTAEGASNFLTSTYFDASRYDLAKVGIYKVNKKFALSARLVGHEAAEDVINEQGDVLVKAGDVIDKVAALAIEAYGINSVTVYPIHKVGDQETRSDKKLKILGNNRVDAKTYLGHFFSENELASVDLEKYRINERVCTDVLREVVAESLTAAEPISRLCVLLQEKRDKLIPRHLTVDDILASVSYFIGLEYGVGVSDDIDHLGNRRIRSVGELLQNSLRVGLTRVERSVRERFQTIANMEEVTPQQVVNTRPISAAIKEFFGSHQLSQFMDQPNPLAELTHKRRLSALGPGGLSRDRANFEVRDVHASHYGRMCPIETPEGPNIGLINSLATYARVNSYGFIETPYRRYDRENGRVTDEIRYMTADEEDNYNIAQANEPIDENGKFVHKKVVCRYFDRFLELEPSKVDYMDVSPKQLVSVATALIPFLGNDDASRALMGSNMQRQAVPLIHPDSPIIGTGMEHRAAKDSGVCSVAKRDGVVEYVAASNIIVRASDDNTCDTYNLVKYQRSNQCTCINQRPLVRMGDKVKAGDILADGPSTDNGELALGQNVLIGFMAWEGYNYEDAVLINERLVREDVYTSIHIEEYECEARETKRGSEEITREIPNVGEDVINSLDEDGIIRIGAEVHAGDILVGKISPKGEKEPTPEEKLYRAIFGDKMREVRDASERVPHGESGIVVDIKTFSRENGDDLKHGVKRLVRVYVAQKRKISVGDKMAGRHGNKGVVSRIMPEEDMPFLPDGTPLDVVLNTMGVPSRMNIGQLLEVHLGLAMRQLGCKIATPVFDGASEEDVVAAFKEAGLPETGKTVLFDGRTGEPFENPVTVGVMYYLKLHHLVDDKIHARSVGRYALVTQQPLGGKAQFGGQRFGEMEVWALEAYGASHTLREILTVKSDDVNGRDKTYVAIEKGENIRTPGTPEAFNVLVKEMQSLGLDVQVYTNGNVPLKLTDIAKDDDDETLSSEEIAAKDAEAFLLENLTIGTLAEDGSLIEDEPAEGDLLDGGANEER